MKAKGLSNQEQFSPGFRFARPGAMGRWAAVFSEDDRAYFERLRAVSGLTYY